MLGAYSPNHQSTGPPPPPPPHRKAFSSVKCNLLVCNQDLRLLRLITIYICFIWTSQRILVQMTNSLNSPSLTGLSHTPVWSHLQLQPHLIESDRKLASDLGRELEKLWSHGFLRGDTVTLADLLADAIISSFSALLTPVTSPVKINKQGISSISWIPSPPNPGCRSAE